MLTSIQMEALWEGYVARVTYSGLVSFTKDRVIYFGTVPRSWLGLTRDLRGDALVAYANLLEAAVMTFRKANVQVTWLELCEEPDKSTKTIPLLTPDNYVMLVRAFKAAIARRNITYVKILGPCLSRIISNSEYAEPYVAAFTGRGTLLDAWSIHVTEPSIDSSRFNLGNYCARTYVQRGMARTIAFMKWINPDIPVFVTKLGTFATKYSTGINYGKGAPESVEHALRIVESMCSVVDSGVSVVLPWSTAEKNDSKRVRSSSNADCCSGLDLRDNRCLIRRDGSRRPHSDALGHVNATLPFGGHVYRREAVPGDDETVALTVVKGNSFGFILGRAHKIDQMNGRYDYSLKNTDWAVSSAPGSTTYEATITLFAFPAYVSLTGTDKTVAIEPDGTLNLRLKELPYNCIIFGRGDAYRL
jgi:hypothetical protein